MTAPRPLSSAWTRRATASLLLSLVGIVSLAGCDPRTLIYFLQPWEPTVDAPGPSLKGKRVVVVTSAVSSARGEYMAIDRELTREVCAILTREGKKVDVVAPEKVWNWVEGHPQWTDPSELAKAFDADIVIFLELEAFQLQSPADINVYQGLAKTHIMVTEVAHPKNTRGKPMTDQPKEARSIYDAYKDTEFPIRGPIPMDTGVSRPAFKNKFLKVVAT
jgi:hypothetical protein